MEEPTIHILVSARHGEQLATHNATMTLEEWRALIGAPTVLALQVDEMIESVIRGPRSHPR